MNHPFQALDGSLVEGFYKGVDHNDYHNPDIIPAISSTQLVKFVLDSPRHFFEISHFNPDREPYEDKDCYQAGRLAHVMMMERDKFDEMYSLKPHKDDLPEDSLITAAHINAYVKRMGIKITGATTNLAKCQKIREFHEQRGHEKASIPAMLPLMLDEWEKGLGEREAVNKKLHMDTQKMVDAFDATEILLEDGSKFKIHDAVRKASVEDTFIWKHEETGLWMKCKTDLRLADIILDYKTARSASPTHFAFDTVKLCYDIRAAMYLDGISQVMGKDFSTFIFLVQEKTRPYVCEAYKLKDDDIDNARLLLSHVMKQIKRCVDTNNWPTYNGGITQIDLPERSVDRRNSEALNRNV